VGGVLAIDHGDRKCGFASTDALGIAREPLGVLRHEGREEVLFAHLERLLAERDVTTLLVGLPLDMDGREGERARLVRAFAARLRARFPALEVVEWDERLTSKEAESRLRERGRRGRAIRAERDSWSALVLLEDWLRSR
jgi:putative Holliday junction resolvase